MDSADQVVDGGVATTEPKKTEEKEPTPDGQSGAQAEELSPTAPVTDGDATQEEVPLPAVQEEAVTPKGATTQEEELHAVVLHPTPIVEEMKQSVVTEDKTEQATAGQLSEAVAETVATATEPAGEKAAPAIEETASKEEDSKLVAADALQSSPMKEEKLSDVEEVVSKDKDSEATATVKFQLMPSSEVLTIASTLGADVASLRNIAATELGVSESNLLIRCNGEELNPQSVLQDLSVSPNGTIRLEIMSMDASVPLKLSVKPKTGSDFITVRVSKDTNEFHDVVVEIERQYPGKPFIGGYRHKLSGLEYHHASAQTAQKKPRMNTILKFNRDCQTVFERNKVQQTTNVTSTQMPKPGCYISSVEDKVITPRTYVTYDEYMAERIKAVIVLQSYFRCWQARHLVRELKLDYERRSEWERLEEIRKRKEKEERIKKEFEKRINPKTREDFDLLYAALEKWRLEEVGHINDEFSGAERKAALCALLEQETQLIGSIDRRKIDACKDGKESRKMQFLNKAAAPKKWKAYDGRFTEMDTQYTIRAKELRDIYSSINMKYLTQDERLDVLLTLKHTVKEHDCKLTREITELIDREADLLMRGMRDSNLEGLRKRVSTLFLQYCKSPLFNPEAARLLKVPQDPTTLAKDIYYCPSSNQYLPSTEFNLTSKSRVVGKCRKVQQLDNEARTRQDYSHYRHMLRALRHSEENYQDNSKIAYLIQEKDLRYLVENIWGAQSILSSWDDLYDLVLVRWDKGEEWSPWNTILLAKDEATAHSRLDNLDEAYSKQFVSKVQHKHTLARVHFVKLPGMAEVLRKKTTGSQRLPGPGTIEGVSAY